MVRVTRELQVRYQASRSFAERVIHLWDDTHRYLGREPLDVRFRGMENLSEPDLRQALKLINYVSEIIGHARVFLTSRDLFSLRFNALPRESAERTFDRILKELRYLYRVLYDDLLSPVMKEYPFHTNLEDEDFRCRTTDLGVLGDWLGCHIWYVRHLRRMTEDFIRESEVARQILWRNLQEDAHPDVCRAARYLDRDYWGLREHEIVDDDDVQLWSPHLHLPTTTPRVAPDTGVRWRPRNWKKEKDRPWKRKRTSW